MFRTIWCGIICCRKTVAGSEALIACAAEQVVASLLVSVLLVGIKLTSARELAQVLVRRRELKANLSLLQRQLEDEDSVAWICDVAYDKAQRNERIAAMESASGHVYTTMETEAIDRGEALFTVFDGSSGRVTQLRRSATMERSETKLDEATRLLLGQAGALIRAKPHDIVAYQLNYDGRHISYDNDPAVDIRCETLQHVSAHHTIVFNRRRAGAGLRDRTFLNSIVVKRLAEDPSTYMLCAVPIPTHAKVRRTDEANAVRAESCRAQRCTEVSPSRTMTENITSLDLGTFLSG
jgi:hypothetical protein